MIQSELMWLAGLLEGDGCFTIAKDHQRGRCRPKVELQMTDKDVLEHAALLMETKVLGPYQRLVNHKSYGAKPMFQVDIIGNKASVLMRHVLPFMGNRRAERIAFILGLGV